METSVKDLFKGCFINIDKPEGPTSHDVDLWMRKILGVEKTGHFGTLDPAVTGVLPIAVGRATRLLQYLAGGKEYVGVMHIHGEVKVKDVKKVITKNFMGVITQLPPKKSRVKREEREREIYDFKILEEKGRDFLFSVKCEAGTYVRKLCHDLGEALGCGAHMTELRRTKAGMFGEKDSVKVDDVVRAMDLYQKGNDTAIKKILMPMETIKEDIKIINIKEEALKRLSHGGPLIKTDLAGKPRLKEGEKVAVAFDNKIILIAKVVKEGDRIAKPETVLI